MDMQHASTKDRTPRMTRFTSEDADRAHAEWGCNCGPGALAAILNMTLDEVRPHLQGFDEKRYTNPTMMFDALKSLGIRHSTLRASTLCRPPWPSYGLARLQWEGPWTAPGVPPRVAYRYTHWVGSWATEKRGTGIFDINAIGNGSGWVRLKDWEAIIVPAITAEYKRANGKWHITHAVEVESSR